MTKTDWRFRACGMGFLLVAVAAALSAQTLTTVHSFSGADGSQPYGPVMQAGNGNLYGTASAGGANSGGTVFEITLGGTMTTLHNFNPFILNDGNQPYGGLVQTPDGDLYGTTVHGGTGRVGTIFRVTPSGTLTTVHNLIYDFGALPYASLFRASDGDLYGTATHGGSPSAGTAFLFTPFGQYVMVHNFCTEPNCEDGTPPVGGLVQASNGNFYGTTADGGNAGCGTAFAMTAGGTVTTIHVFSGHDGCLPQATLILGSDGNFYGTTVAGGDNQGANDGTVFRMTASGVVTLLHTFSGSDGASPFASLLEASDGNFYGTTESRGANGGGTIFRMTPDGTVTTLYNFCAQSSCGDGANPYAALIEASDGNLYGTTFAGGVHNNGTVFRLAVGPGPGSRK